MDIGNPGAVVTAGLKMITTPPVSTVNYQNTSGVMLFISGTVSMSPTALAAAGVLIQISPDSTNWTQLGYESVVAGMSALAGSTRQISFAVPAGWYYKITCTNSTPGAFVALG